MSIALEGLRSEGYHSAVLWTLSDYPQAESFYVATGWRLNGARRRDGQQVRYDVAEYRLMMAFSFTPGIACITQLTS